MALGYSSRRTTDDADVIMAPDVAAEVLPAAEQVAASVSRRVACSPSIIIRRLFDCLSILFSVPPKTEFLSFVPVT